MNKLRKWLFQIAPPEIIIALRHIARRKQRKISPLRAFSKRNIYVADHISQKRVLILAPHPDDEAIGMGATLWMHLQNKSDVTVLYMTDGRGPGAPDTTLAAQRKREAQQLAQVYPFRQVFWDTPDNQLTNDDDTVQKLIGVITDTRPELIYITSFFEHQFDHYAANKILADALQNMGYPSIAVLGYEVWDNISFPNYIVDISANFDKKADMLRHYAIPHQYTDFTQLCQHRNALHYLLYVSSKIQQPIGYAEVFFRSDARTYCEIFADYTESLQSVQSELPAHTS